MKFNGIFNSHFHNMDINKCLFDISIVERKYEVPESKTVQGSKESSKMNYQGLLTEAKYLCIMY